MVPIAVVGAIVGWLYLFFTGCENSACHALGVYTHRVETLDDYRAYLMGEDLYSIHRASSLQFSCDSLRDQLVRALHRSMVAEAPLGEGDNIVKREVERLGLMHIAREGHTLHMTDDVTIGEENLDVWVEHLSLDLAKDPANMREEWVFAAMRRLFETVVLHAGPQERVIRIADAPRC